MRTLDAAEKIVMVKFSDLEMAFDFMSFDSYGEHESYLCIETGKIYYSSDLIDDEEEELPEDIYDNDKYIEIPSKRDMDLGKSQQLSVRKFFTKKIKKIAFAM